MTSPAANPAAAAGESGSTMSILTPDSRWKREMANDAARDGNGLAPDAKPRAAHAALADQRNGDALGGRRRNREADALRRRG